MAMRLGRGEGHGREGDPHHNLPRVQVPVRLPDRQRQRPIGPGEAGPPEKAPRGRLRRHLPVQPERQRAGVREVRRGLHGGDRNQANPSQGSMPEAVIA